MKTGVILAGGRATRLGPVAAQLSKALVSVGQRPVLVHHVETLRHAGCTGWIWVVTSPRGDQQIREVIVRAGLDKVTTRVQGKPTGPGDALWTAIGWQRWEHVDEEIVLLLADTYLAKEELVLLPEHGVAVAWRAGGRSWCLRSGGRWEDRELAPEDRATVAVGAYRLNAKILKQVTDVARHTDRRRADYELGMAAILQRYDEAAGIAGRPLSHSGKTRVSEERPGLVTVETWRDLGDVEALWLARRSLWLGRGKRNARELELTDRGTVIKREPSGAEYQAWHSVRNLQRAGRDDGDLYPRVVSMNDVDPAYVETEHVAGPSLAELWCYWPGRPELWEALVTRVVDALRTWHWQESAVVDSRAPDDWQNLLVQRARNVYVTGPMQRLEEWDDDLRTFTELQVNGVTCVAGQYLLDRLWLLVGRCLGGVTGSLEEALRRLVRPGVVHGDPNFSNAFVNLDTGTVRLLDPRGTWGGSGSLGDVTYDRAKLGYSRWWVPVVHGLYTLEQPAPGGHVTSDEWTVRIWPEREAENEAVERALFASAAGVDLRRGAEQDDWRRLVEGLLLVAGAPLHRGDEARAMYLLGVMRLNEEVARLADPGKVATLPDPG